MSRRTHIRHQPIADGLRSLPGQWGEVDNYQWRDAANGIARFIRTGGLPAYRPAGSFEAEVRLDDEGDAHVYARYIGQPAPARGHIAAQTAADQVRQLLKDPS